MIYDLLIIGGGPAGYRAAVQAGRSGLKVALFESKSLGGVCLNEGCIPTKTLLYSAKNFDFANGIGAKYGVEAATVTLNHAKVLMRKSKVVRTLVAGVASQLKNAGVELVSAQAQIKGKNENIFVVSADDCEYAGRNILIATGSSAAIPEIFRDSLESGFAITSCEALELDEIPATMVVCGGGAVGLELASYFNSVGSKVTVVEMLDRIGGASLDLEIATLLQKEAEKKGIKILLNSRIVGVADGRVELETPTESIALDADKLLVAAGRKPNICGLGLENIGVQLVNNAIVTDEKMRTNVVGVYAAGDVNGKSMLAHTAYREAEVAVNSILGVDDAVNYLAIPAVIYTNPECGSIGESAASAAAKNLQCEEKVFSMRLSGRYLAENEGGNGMIKLIVTPDRKIIGGSILGNPASEIIANLGIVIENQLPISALAKTVFPHPTVSEIFHDIALELE